jgi:hypothetical protein
MSQQPPPLHLSELAATLRARTAGPDGQLRQREQWVLVDADDMVISVEDWGRPARARLNELFDQDASAVDGVRLLVLVDGIQQRCEWPRRGTSRERALALVRYLNEHDDWDANELAATVRHYYLRGTPATLQLDGAALPGGWLTWMSAREPHIPVGLAVCLASRRWVLLADERTPALSQPETLHRLAEGVTAFSGEVVAATAVEDVLDRQPAGLTPASWLLARLAVNVGQRLGVLPGEWSQVRGGDDDE